MSGLQSILATLLPTLLAAACAHAPTPTPVQDQVPWPAHIGLSEIRTVGDLPAAPGRVVVGLDAVGRLSVDREDATIEDLRSALRDAAVARGAENVDVVLALDARVPWGAAARLVVESAIAGVDRLFFAAQPADGTEPGAIAIFLPSEHGRVRGTGPAVTVFVRDGWPPSDVLSLHDVFRDGAEPGSTRVALDAAPTTPMDVVLRIADVAALERAAVFEFSAIALPSLPPGELLEEVSRLTADRPARRVVVFDRALDQPSLLVPHAERVSGAYAGFFHDAVPR